MHELAVTQSLLKLVLEHAERAEARRITRINLVIGELSGVVDDCVQFYFDFVSKGTIAESAVLSFERVISRWRCRACGEEFVLQGEGWTCPACGTVGGEVIAGRELYVDSIEIEPQEDGEARGTPREKKKEANMPKILVVDDDPDFVLICRNILETEGYQVLEAASGRRALAMMRQDRPDLVLLDVMMTTILEGVDVCREMQSEPRLKNVPVVMISSIATSEYAAEFPDDEPITIDAWISKPIQPDVLLKTVKRFVG